MKLTQAHDLCSCSEQLEWSYGGAAGGGMGGWSGEPQTPLATLRGLHAPPLMMRCELPPVGGLSCKPMEPLLVLGLTEVQSHLEKKS